MIFNSIELLSLGLAYLIFLFLIAHIERVGVNSD
jgi:hypothetical protein